MSFFHRKRPLEERDKPDNTVRIFFGDYYHDYGDRYTGTKSLICIMPYYEDADGTFGELMRSFGTELLSSFPFVAEQLLGGHIRHTRVFRGPQMEPIDLLSEAYITKYQLQGGRLYTQGKNDLIALSQYDAPKLLPLIPVGGLTAAAYCGYGAQEMPHGWGEGGKELWEEAQYEFCLICSEYHDHLLIETSDDPQYYIDLLKKHCQQEGRMLILELLSEGTGRTCLQEQQLL